MKSSWRWRTASFTVVGSFRRVQSVGMTIAHLGAMIDDDVATFRVNVLGPDEAVGRGRSLGGEVWGTGEGGQRTCKAGWDQPQ